MTKQEIWTRLNELLQVGMDMESVRQMVDRRPATMSMEQWLIATSDAGIQMRKYQAEAKDLGERAQELGDIALESAATHAELVVCLSSSVYKDNRFILAQYLLNCAQEVWSEPIALH